MYCFYLISSANGNDKIFGIYDIEQYVTGTNSC